MPTFSLLRTIAATAGDIVRAGGTVTITNSPPFGYEGISSLVRTASVAETLQITTLTPTAAATSTYSGIVTQYDIATNKTLTGRFSYTTAASGDTATTIGNAIRSELNQFVNAGALKVALTGTTTVIITALTRYPIFTVTLTQLGGGLTQSTGTAGVQSVNLAADVLLAYSKAGLPAPTLTGASYTSYAYRYATAGPLDLGNVQRNVQDLNTLFVDNTLGTNYTNFNASMVEIQSSYVSGGTTVDPLLVSRPVAASGQAEN
jgi:hypothetical protein